MVKTLYVSLNNNNPDPILWEEPDDTAFKALKESFMNTPPPRPALGNPTYQILFFFLYTKRKEMPLW